MRLVHFARQPLGDLYSTVHMLRDGMKPKGLWVSDEDDETSWRTWCTNEEFDLGPIEHEITLAADATILRIEDIDDLDALTHRYGSPRHGDCYDIDWPRVAQKYQGILITPYLWERRMVYGWYYSWDCASGCIWDPGAVASVTRCSEVVSP